MPTIVPLIRGGIGAETRGAAAATGAGGSVGAFVPGGVPAGVPAGVPGGAPGMSGSGGRFIISIVPLNFGAEAPFKLKLHF